MDSLTLARADAYGSGPERVALLLYEQLRDPCRGQAGAHLARDVLRTCADSFRNWTMRDVKLLYQVALVREHRYLPLSVSFQGD